MQESNGVILEIHGINKSFTATKAVVDVSLQVNKGEVRGLIGENGSGKSTLASMISGLLKPDSGTMTLKGQNYAPSSMLEGRKSGISILVQEMGTINHLKVYDNIFLGKEDHFRKFGVINRNAMIEASKRILADIGASHINPTDNVDDVCFEDRKLIEVAMAMYDRPDILILDETTTALSQKGRKKIYSIINNMKEEGRTVIFISHDLLELEKVSDNISVLRDGHLIQTLAKEEITVDKMKHLMIGRDLSSHYYREDASCSYQDEVVLKVENVSLEKSLFDVSLELHKGEILGLGGLTECGMHELCKIMFGVTKPDTGKVTITSSNKAIKHACNAVSHKMAFIPKNREQEALMTGASIKDNIVLMSYDKLKTGPFLSKRREMKLATEQSKLLKIKMVNINQACMFLSGGNKQKVVVAKWLANDSEILIMDCPTRGIDIGVKAAIYTLMEDLKRQGKSIIMVSEELPELLGMSDRIIIMKDGRLSGEFRREPGLSEKTIIHKMI